MKHIHLKMPADERHFVVVCPKCTKEYVDKFREDKIKIKVFSDYILFVCECGHEEMLLRGTR